MTIAYRIKELRKKKGISQEELADKIGVSRQAVSKWESEQSTPDLDKIIVLSDFFHVTTDYILKGIEANDNAVEKINGNIVATLATAFNFIGIIIASVFWYKKRSILAVVIGIIIMVLACAIFAVAISYASKETIIRAKRNFLSRNIWIISIIPISLIYNLIICREPFPFPISKYTFGMRIGLASLYCIFCGAVVILSLWKYNKTKIYTDYEQNK